jgi:hypothetical protein
MNTLFLCISSIVFKKGKRYGWAVKLGHIIYSSSASRVSIFVVLNAQDIEVLALDSAFLPSCFGKRLLSSPSGKRPKVERPLARARIFSLGYNKLGILLRKQNNYFIFF